MSKNENNPLKIVAFGDSLTFGHGIEKNENKWTSIIERELNYEVINSGINGNTSTQGLSRIKEDVLVYKPDYVIVNFGMNDHFMNDYNIPKTPLDGYRANLIKIAELIIAEGGTPVFVIPHKILEGEKGDDNGKGATYYYGRHPYKFYRDVEGANSQLKRYCDVIKEVAETLKLPLVDMYSATENLNPHEFLITLENSSEEDGVHINDQGARLYGENIIKKLNEIIKTK